MPPKKAKAKASPIPPPIPPPLSEAEFYHLVDIVLRTPLSTSLQQEFREYEAMKNERPDLVERFKEYITDMRDGRIESKESYEDWYELLPVILYRLSIFDENALPGGADMEFPADVFPGGADMELPADVFPPADVSGDRFPASPFAPMGTEEDEPDIDLSLFDK